MARLFDSLIAGSNKKKRKKKKKEEEKIRKKGIRAFGAIDNRIAVAASRPCSRAADRTQVNLIAPCEGALCVSSQPRIQFCAARLMKLFGTEIIDTSRANIRAKTVIP